jgi:hypothetical protein
MNLRDKKAIEYMIPETPEQAARFEGFRDGFDKATDLFIEFMNQKNIGTEVLTSARREFYECRTDKN